MTNKFSTRPKNVNNITRVLHSQHPYQPSSARYYYTIILYFYFNSYTAPHYTYFSYTSNITQQRTVYNNNLPWQNCAVVYMQLEEK